MSRRKKSSKLIPILFAVLIIFLAVLVVNNYLTYQAFQESERQYQDFQQQLIEDAMNEEVVEETTEEITEEITKEGKSTWPWVALILVVIAVIVVAYWLMKRK